MYVCSFFREDEIAMYESQALHESLARRSAPCLVSPRPASAPDSSERFSCGPGDDGPSPWPDTGAHGEEVTPCSADPTPLYSYVSSGSQAHPYVGDGAPYQYLGSHGESNEWRYDSENCYYQGTQFNNMTCQLKMENGGWDAQIHRLPHHDVAGREFYQGSYGPYSSVLLGPARTRQSLRSRKDGIMDGCDVTTSHGPTTDTAVGSDPCPALKRAVLEWARRLKVKRQIMTTYRTQEPCFSSVDYKGKNRKRSHCDAAVLMSPVPYKAEIDYAPCVEKLPCAETPVKRRVDCTGQVLYHPHIVDIDTNAIITPSRNLKESSIKNKRYSTCVGLQQVEPQWWSKSTSEIRVPDCILTPDSSPSHEDSPGKLRHPPGALNACTPESNKPITETHRQDDRHISDEESEPIVGTLEDAVGKALCALSSDELRLLDQATLSLLYQNPSRQTAFPKRTVANSDNK